MAYRNLISDLLRFNTILSSTSQSSDDKRVAIIFWGNTEESFAVPKDPQREMVWGDWMGVGLGGWRPLE